MDKLSAVVAKKATEMSEDGTIERLIEKSVTKTIESAIEKALQSYSAFGKEITKKIEEACQIASSNVTLPEYNVYITEVIQKQFSQVLGETTAKHLEQLVNKIVSPVNKDCKISELLDQVQELWGDLARSQNQDEIEIITEYSDDDKAIYVTFVHPEDGEETKATFYKFSGHTYHIGYINERGVPITNKPTDRAKSYSNDICDLLFKYWAMRTEFELDVDIESIYVD